MTCTNCGVVLRPWEAYRVDPVRNWLRPLCLTCSLAQRAAEQEKKA